MDKGLFKAFKHYHKHRKGYQEKLDVFTKYLDGLEHDLGMDAPAHQETKEEKQMALQAEKTLGNIRKLLKSLD